MVLHFFGSTSMLTISRFGELFRNGHYSLVSFSFAVRLLTMPPCPAISKSGGTCSLCPMESAPLHWVAPKIILLLNTITEVESGNH